MKPLGTINRPIKVALYVAGVWPDLRYPVLCRLFWIITMIIIQIFQYRYIIVNFGTEDLTVLVDGLSTTLPYSLFFFKLIIFWVNRRVFSDIVASMARDWQEQAVIDSPMMTKTASRAHRFSNVIIGLYSMAVVLYGAGVLVSHEEDEENDVPSRELFLKMELPFESNTSPVYELVMVTQFLHQLTSAATVGTLNALLVAVILHTGSQIDIMCRKLREVSLENGSRLRNIISRHQEIITFAENIEKLFTYIALMQFISNTLIICCLGFLIAISIGAETKVVILVKSVTFYCAISVEAFIFSFAGEYLSAKSKMIGNAAYGSLWYDMRPNESRILLLMIIRSQKGLYISIGKVMNLSLECFATIVKASASYISVLLAMY